MSQQVVIAGAGVMGRLLAWQLARAGHRVFAGVRKQSDADALRAEGLDGLEPLLFDVTDAAAVDAAAKTVAEEVGEAGLGGVVANAGVGVAGPLEVIELALQLSLPLRGRGRVHHLLGNLGADRFEQVLETLVLGNLGDGRVVEVEGMSRSLERRRRRGMSTPSDLVRRLLEAVSVFSARRRDRAWSRSRTATA